MQFNGYQGVDFAKNPGVTVSKGRGFVRVYPYRRESTLRNYIETVECAEQALDSQQPICGVKGPSVLYNIPKFDIVENFVPDYMHCVLLGVVRQMMALWLDSQYHTERYYLAAHIDNLDFRLLSIKPPCNISRVPRSVTLRKYWKAHEWYAWLIFYSVPVLKGIQPQKYFSHWCLLVEAVSIMLGESIFTNQLDYCGDVLVRFVFLLEKLYGVQHVSYNVHLLLHLVKSVKDWGPLWAHSAFLYESYNGCLLQMIKGTQGVPLQICKKFLIEKALLLHATEMAGTPKGELLNYFIGTNRKIKLAEEIEGGAALGRSCQRVLKREHYLALHSFVNEVDPTIIATYNDRIVIGKEIVHTKLYRKAKKRNSYTVILKDSSFFSIETFVILDLGCGRKCYALGRFFQNRNFKICSDNALNIGLSHIFPVSPELGHLVAVESCVIQQKCVFVYIPGQTVAFVCKQPNRFELCR
ncbi:hypothetical protein HHUSO_G29953 [Huso huso]|uniref:Uncharacterized protein n=1 Tax=Huso huso TaxID=61971 RepID=A0ABR0YEP5_HUSHU